MVDYSNSRTSIFGGGESTLTTFVDSFIPATLQLVSSSSASIRVGGGHCRGGSHPAVYIDQSSRTALGQAP
jgi:hypothetical protein